MIKSHEVSVVVGRVRLPGWKDYSISVDMLQPADGFSMAVQFTPERWRLLHTDARVDVFIDSTRILAGFVDIRKKKSGRGEGTMIQITGRDKTGRLVDESAPLFRYGGLRLKSLAEKIVGITDDDDPIFERVVLVNTRNRSLLRNSRARQARAVREPLQNAALGLFASAARPLGLFAPAAVLASTARDPRANQARTRLISASAAVLGVLPAAAGALERVERPPKIEPGIFNGRSAPKKVQPGDTRWAVLEEFLREARLIAWSTGDGKDLFVGLPNYEQEPQWFFFEAGSQSDNRDGTNCTIEVVESVADRYSKITCVGAAKATRSNYGKNVTKNRATVFDNPDNTRDGTGLAFTRRKALLITDDSIRNPRDALERAEREQLERDAGGLEIVVDAPGHSQLFSGEEPAIFAVDTIATINDEDTQIRGEFLVTSCDFTQSRQEGTRTRMRMVPKGTLLQL